MSNYSAIVEYDGTSYKGFQAQPGNVCTVQGELLKALNIVLSGAQILEFGYAGRTDSGVHAKHQVINFKTGKELDLYRFKWKLNCVLPDDIVIKEVDIAAEDFDSRKDAVLRQYSYYLVNNHYQSAFLKRYSMLITGDLDVGLMREAAEKFCGVKDFASFCNNSSGGNFTVREIYSFNIRKYSGGLIVFKISANAYLYNMVRIIVGTVIEIGMGKRSIESIDKAFEARKRTYAGKIVPAKGLFLTNVVY
jgi:tRNA pseudouridine38-40 synthase